MQAVYTADEKTGLFAAGDIKVRPRSFRHFKSGAVRTAVRHVFGNVMEGRSAEQRANLSRKIIERLRKMFPDVSRARQIRRTTIRVERLAL